MFFEVPYGEVPCCQIDSRELFINSCVDIIYYFRYDMTEVSH